MAIFIRAFLWANIYVKVMPSCNICICIYSSKSCCLLKLIFLDAPEVQKQTHYWFDTTELNLTFQKTYIYLLILKKCMCKMMILLDGYLN